MKHLAAYCLLVLGGNATPSKFTMPIFILTFALAPSSWALDALAKHLELA